MQPETLGLVPWVPLWRVALVDEGFRSQAACAGSGIARLRFTLELSSPDSHRSALGGSLPNVGS